MNIKKYKLPECIVPEDIKIQPDWELLKELLYFQTPSKSVAQDQFIDWIVEWVKIQGIDVESHKDVYGNLYITKGESNLYPCIISHCDINQDYKLDWEIFTTHKYIFGFDNETGEQCGMGADDKCGVAFALQMLIREDISHLKCYFAKDEECGATGTKQCDMKFFDNCSLMMQGDRRSDNNDISESTNGINVVSQEFIDAMRKLNFKYGYNFTYCMFTDVGEIKKRGANCIGFNFS